MSPFDRKYWVAAVLIVGVSYFLVGFVFAGLARWSALNLSAVAWNKLALVVSAIAFALHIGYEHFRFQHRPRTIAWHTALAVALGAFGLALAANIHDLGSPAGYRPRMLLALIAWPLVTAVPAFFVALIVALVFNLVGKKTHARPGEIQ